MRTQAYNYRIIVERDPDAADEVYVAYAPSLGISDFGNSIDEAVEHIDGAINLYLKTLVELNEPVPAADPDDYYVTSRAVTLQLPATS